MRHDDGWRSPSPAPRSDGGQFACIVEDEFPVAVVRVAGDLASATVPRLREVVRKCLAEQPAGVIVDLTGARLRDDRAVLVLRSLARQAARWPGCPLVVHGAAPEVADALRRLAVTRTVPLFPDRTAARAHLAECPVPARLVADLPATSEATVLARDTVRDACRHWRLPDLGPHAEAVATELVANALRHAGGPLRLTVSRLDRYLHVAVRDGSRSQPRLSAPDHEFAPSGRGLLVVDAFAASWGALDTADGKVVWAVLRTG